MRSAPTCIHSATALFTLAAAIAICSPALAASTTVELPAGSVNGLAAAISQAGTGGTVILKSGLHKESGTVVVTAPVHLAGEAGAILESATSPGCPNTFPITIAAALHFKGASGSTVDGLWFQPPATTLGSCGVILEDSPGAQVLNNRMTQFQFGIIVQRSDGVAIHGNAISTPTNWDLDPSDPTFLSDAEGIIVLGGERAQVTDNQVSNAFIGILGSDRFGQMAGNRITGNAYGILFCHAPESLYLFSGSKQGSNLPATGWLVVDNTAHNNLWGLAVTGGSHDNILANNDASGNQVYDIELTGDTKRFAPYPPVNLACYDNRVMAGTYQGLVVKDCGMGNQLIGNVKLVDHGTDPCN